MTKIYNEKVIPKVFATGKVPEFEGLKSVASWATKTARFLREFHICGMFHTETLIYVLYSYMDNTEKAPG